ncbi:MAG: YbeD family protein [Gammaproteobacteria bacterium]|nr:MAG: YbeD family protein [Gammaproteobacteria bacterium]
MKECDSLLEFPCDFPIKVMGRSDSGFEARALAIVCSHVHDFDAANMRSAVSRKGNYISVTFDLRATSQEQLDELYRELTACEEVSMVL